jgi:O-antigen ligase
VALLAALLVIALIVFDARVLPLFLIATLFVESVGIGGGLRIGRLAAVMALAVVLYYLLVRGSAGLVLSPPLLVAGALGAWMFASAFWASHPNAVYRSMFEYALAVAYMFAFAVLVRSQSQLLAVFRVLTIGALIFGVVAFAAYVTHKQTFVATGGGATGGQGDHNLFAVYQVLALPAALTVAATDPRPRRLIAYAALPAIVLSVIAALSRTGFVLLAAGILVTFIAPSRYFFRSSVHKLWYVVTMGIVAVAVAAAGASQFIDRVHLIFSAGASNDRASGRVDLWRAAWHGYQQANPLLGIGSGNFQRESVRLLQTTPGVDSSAPYASYGRVVHNIYLGALTELGLVGLILLLALLVLTAQSLVASLRRARVHGDETFVRVAAALLVSLLVIALAGLSLSIQLGKPLWIIIGAALALEVMSRSAARRSPTDS